MTRYLESCAERHRVALDEIRCMLDAFATADIDAMPFKGPALAARAYADPSLRSCLDLDILVREPDVDRALRTLANLGFVSQYPSLRDDHRAAYHHYNGEDCLFSPSFRLPVEPHWAVAPRMLAVSLDTTGLFDRAQDITLAGRAVRTLSPEDTLLTTALHAGKEEWARLIMISDLAALLVTYPAMDATAVLARAEAARARRMLLVGITLARDLLDAPVPVAFANAISADRATRRLAARIADRIWEQHPVTSMFVLSPVRWRMRDCLSDRIRYAAATLTTPRVEYLQMVDLPAGLRRLYPLMRLGHDFVGLPLWQLIRRRGT